MNGKQIKGYGALIFLLILALTVVSCGQPSGGGKEGQATEPPAAKTTEPTEAKPPAGGEQATPQLPTEQVTAQASPTAVSEATKSPTVEAAEPTETEPPAGGEQATPQPPAEQPTAQAGSTPAMASVAALDSYRIHTTWREDGPEGPVKTQWDTEFVADPLAVHHKAEGETQMEMVFIGQTMWSKFADLPWRKIDLGKEQTADWGKMLSQEQSPVNVEEQTPLEDDIQWVMGQPVGKIAEGSLSPAGQETVNGVACKRYTVDSTYTYGVQFQAPLSGSATVTELTQGEIWVADEGGWSPFVVRMEILKTETTQVSGGASSTATEYIESNVTDINASDIVIEPPQ